MVKGSEAKLVRHNLKVAWRNLLKYILITIGSQLMKLIRINPARVLKDD